MLLVKTIIINIPAVTTDLTANSVSSTTATATIIIAVGTNYSALGWQDSEKTS